MAWGTPSKRVSVECLGWNAACWIAIPPLLVIALTMPVLAQDTGLPQESKRLSSALQALASDDPSVQEDTLRTFAALSDPVTLPLLTSLYEGTLHVWTSGKGKGQVVILQSEPTPEGGKRNYLVDPLTGKTLKDLSDEPTEAEGEFTLILVKSSTGRRILKDTLDRLRLFDQSVEIRRAAATRIGNAGDSLALPLLQRSLMQETDKWARHAMEVAASQVQLADPNPVTRREAASRLGQLKGLQALPRLKSLLSEEPVEPDEAVRKAIQDAIQSIETYQDLQGFVGVGFNGLSLGSILLLMGLGLAITFGLMGVINMAHGEMMMIGAYTAFVLQELFAAHLAPWLHGAYFLAALPLSFIVTGAVGFVLEKTVIRFLYGRPLETLLATWGISMVLQQAARWYFGDLTSVNAPTWMRGGVEPMVGLVLPYNRMFIIVLGAGALVGVHLLLSRTRWGLRIRAVTQNRDMSACLGISTHTVDAWTFALGTGLAGLAGCAISLIGNVDPEMGKTYIVESFMVVVVGGVGKLAGTVASAMGIGMLSKILEPMIGGTGGAIYAKLFILAAIILFLQHKPSGLFPAKGRAAEG